MSNTTSFSMLVVQSASVNSSYPVSLTETRVGFFRHSFDCAFLETRIRTDEVAAGSFDAEAGIMTGDFCDCFAFKTIIARVADGLCETGMELRVACWCRQKIVLNHLNAEVGNEPLSVQLNS